MTTTFVPAMAALRAWPARRWIAAAVFTALTAVLIGVPTDLIDTPLFSRAIAPAWWSYPVWGLTAALTGLLCATYLADPAQSPPQPAASRAAGLGGVLSFLAVGCPVCNKAVLLAVGSSGALRWFAPAQPIVSVVGLVLLVWAVRTRLIGEQRRRLPATTS